MSDIRTGRDGTVAVTWTWRWRPTPMAEVIGCTPPAPQDAAARLRRSESGWVVNDAGLPEALTEAEQRGMVAS